ncbi:MAG: carbohydrate kinase family protein [Methanosarcinales archaeon]|nr:carbohydrate kinase family protein [ANME-2 cluster archaeon]MDW7775187.1 carbohydrate kinase family protein [Methanosarcinales archaeon]
MTLQMMPVHSHDSPNFPQVVGFGALNLDRIYYVDRIVRPDEEGFISSVENHPGGSAANTIVGLSRLGIATGYVGKVADDEAGRLLLDDLASEGVNTRGVRISSGRSGECLIMVDGQGERGILVDPGVNDTITIADVEMGIGTHPEMSIDMHAKINIDISMGMNAGSGMELMNNAGLIHFTSFVCRASDTSFETQKQVAARTKAGITFDPGTLYAERGLEALIEFIRRARVVLPNDHELELMTGCRDVRDGAYMLIEAGAQWVAVKMGSRGCYVTDGTLSIELQPHKVDVVDTTGAGDAFNAGFIFGMLKGKDIETCGRMGTITASISIGHRGARGGLPSRDELDAVIRALSGVS